MRIPTIRGIIDRRVLVNYRVRPQALSALLPAPFRPKTVGGYGIAGICLIRLAQVRPRLVPHWLGLSSENAAHRIAVEWDEAGMTREGVYIPRRDTNSRWNALVGGRLFPGMHQHAAFTIRESADLFEIGIRADDDKTRIEVRGRVTERFPESSVFASLAEASAFFESGSLGYSATRRPGRFDGLELRCGEWRVEPLEVELVQSSFFEDESQFPRGTVEFDCALLMRGIAHEWHGCAEMRTPAHASAALRPAPSQTAPPLLPHSRGC